MADEDSQPGALYLPTYAAAHRACFQVERSERYFDSSEDRWRRRSLHPDAAFNQYRTRLERIASGESSGFVAAPATNNGNVTLCTASNPSGQHWVAVRFATHPLSIIVLDSFQPFHAETWRYCQLLPLVAKAWFRSTLQQLPDVEDWDAVVPQLAPWYHQKDTDCGIFTVNDIRNMRAFGGNSNVNLFANPREEAMMIRTLYTAQLQSRLCNNHELSSADAWAILGCRAQLEFDLPTLTANFGNDCNGAGMDSGNDNYRGDGMVFVDDDYDVAGMDLGDDDYDVAGVDLGDDDYDGNVGNVGHKHPCSPDPKSEDSDCEASKNDAYPVLQSLDTTEQLQFNYRRDILRRIVGRARPIEVCSLSCIEGIVRSLCIGDWGGNEVARARNPL